VKVAFTETSRPFIEGSGYRLRHDQNGRLVFSLLLYQLSYLATCCLRRRTAGAKNESALFKRQT
jgi:hypothetical protein